MEQENQISIDSVREECKKDEEKILAGIYDRTTNKEQIFIFQRKLEKNERDYLSEIIERMQINQDRIIEARTQKEEKLTIKNPQKEINEATDELMGQMERFRKYAEEKELIVMRELEEAKEHNLFIKLPKLNEKTANTVIMNADGDMADQEQEFMMINGTMTHYDIQRINQFRQELREIDQQMNTSGQMDEYQLQNTAGLLQKYNDCKNNMVGYVNTHIRNGNIKTFPQKDLQKEINKAQQKETQKEKELEDKKEEKEQKQSKKLKRNMTIERQFL